MYLFFREISQGDCDAFSFIAVAHSWHFSGCWTVFEVKSSDLSLLFKDIEGAFRPGYSAYVFHTFLFLQYSLYHLFVRYFRFNYSRLNLFLAPPLNLLFSPLDLQIPEWGLSNCQFWRLSICWIKRWNSSLPSLVFFCCSSCCVLLFRSHDCTSRSTIIKTRLYHGKAKYNRSLARTLRALLQGLKLFKKKIEIFWLS